MLEKSPRVGEIIFVQRREADIQGVDREVPAIVTQVNDGGQFERSLGMIHCTLFTVNGIECLRDVPYSTEHEPNSWHWADKYR